MRPKSLMLVIVLFVVLLGAVAALVLLHDDPHGAQQPPPKADSLSATMPNEEAWTNGPFSSLDGINIRAELDRNLMLILKAEPPEPALEALRAKLAAFLKAYSGVDFDKYLEFRPPSGMCNISDERLAPALKSWSPKLGEPPAETKDLVASAWRLYVAEGMGPVRPGPVIDAVKWPSCRVEINRIPRREIVIQEWDEMSPGQGLLNKDAADYADARGPHVTLRPVVPNAVTVNELMQRDDGLLFADFDVVCRSADSPPRRLILRFIWRPVANDWLPLHSLAYGGGMRKPFVW